MIDHVIIVPCHSIWHPLDESSHGADAGEWALALFQVEGHDHLCFVDHICQALAIAHKDTQLIVIMSGGQTKRECGRVSEAELYYKLARRLISQERVPIKGDEGEVLTDDILGRVLVEEYARDLFENVLFSICRFYEMIGRYPSRITVVGFEFKRYRFEKLHLQQALAWDMSKVRYFGNLPSPDADVEEYFTVLKAQEAKNAVVPFEKDWYGALSPLADKKKQRNPFGQVVPYPKLNPQLTEAFLRMDRGERERVRDVLPWCHGRPK